MASPSTPHAGLTLAGADEYVLEHHGPIDGPSFSATVRGLHAARLLEAELKETKSQLGAILMGYHERGVVQVRPNSYIKLHPAKPDTTKPTIVANHIRKRWPKRWEAARVRQPYIVLKSPPAPPRSSEPIARLAHYAAADRWTAVAARLRSVKTEQAYFAEQLTALAERLDWDGDPLLFDDGWTVGTTRIAFDGATLKSLYPDEYEQMCIPKTVAGPAARITIERGVAPSVLADDDDGQSGVG